MVTLYENKDEIFEQLGQREEYSPQNKQNEVIIE